MSWDTPQSAFVSSESGWIREKREENICGNDLIVSMRILSNHDASMCFPEPRADINNVVYPALCGLAEECWWRESQTRIWSARFPTQSLKPFYWAVLLKLQPGPWLAVCSRERPTEKEVWRKLTPLLFGRENLQQAWWLLLGIGWFHFVFPVPEGIGQLHKGPENLVSVQLLLTRYDWPLKCSYERDANLLESLALMGRADELCGTANPRWSPTV